MYSYLPSPLQGKGPSRSEVEIDLDAMVVALLARLAGDRVTRFTEQVSPSKEIVKHIEGAGARETRALICLVLRRWCELEG